MLGNTSHLANSSGALLEWYRYDLQGTPFFYNALNTQLSTSNYSVRHLFTGQRWYSQLGLYDLRNRFYSPDIGRFLQPDPIRFRGDRSNLYRYCGNNPVTRSDPSGLVGNLPSQYGNDESDYPPVKVTGHFPDYAGTEAGPLDWSGGLPGEGSPFDGFGPLENLGRFTFEFVAFINVPKPPGPPPSAPPPQNPEPPAISVTVAAGPIGGIQVTFTTDHYGQMFLFGGFQIGKSWPVSGAVTGDYVIGQKNPSAAQIAQSRKGFGWSASGGYYSGFQLSGPANSQIFLPSITGAGAGPPSSWGGGFVSPQFGIGLGYTWQLPTLANPLPPYSPTYAPEGP